MECRKTIARSKIRAWVNLLLMKNRGSVVSMCHPSSCSPFFLYCRRQALGAKAGRFRQDGRQLFPFIALLINDTTVNCTAPPPTATSDLSGTYYPARHQPCRLMTMVVAFQFVESLTKDREGNSVRETSYIPHKYSQETHSMETAGQMSKRGTHSEGKDRIWA